MIADCGPVSDGFSGKESVSLKRLDCLVGDQVVVKVALSNKCDRSSHIRGNRGVNS